MSRTFQVTASHSSPTYQVNRVVILNPLFSDPDYSTGLNVMSDGDKFYACGGNFGCGRSYSTPEAAIFGLLYENGCKNIVIAEIIKSPITPILVRTTRNVGPFWHIRVRRMVTGCDYVNFSSTRDETKATDLALKDACRRTEYSTLAGFRVVDVIPVTVIERMERVDHDMPHTDTIIESDDPAVTNPAGTAVKYTSAPSAAFTSGRCASRVLAGIPSPPASEAPTMATVILNWYSASDMTTSRHLGYLQAKSDLAAKRKANKLFPMDVGYIGLREVTADEVETMARIEANLIPVPTAKSDPATDRPDMLPHPSPEATVIATAHANLRHAVESVEPNYDDIAFADYMEARRKNNGVAPDSHLTPELIALRQSADAALRNHGIAPSYFTGERLRDLAEQLCSLGVITPEVFAMARDLSHDYPVLKIEGETLFHDGWLWRHCNESWNAPIDGSVFRPAALYSATTAQMYLKSRLLCGSTFDGSN